MLLPEDFLSTLIDALINDEPLSISYGRFSWEISSKDFRKKYSLICY
jgi:hypothetical protein